MRIKTVKCQARKTVNIVNNWHVLPCLNSTSNMGVFA